MKAQTKLGARYLQGRWGVTRNYTEAVKWYRKAAEKGFAEAQNSLGQMYASGQGVDKNYDEAAKWFRKAAEQGNAEAQNSLGKMYASGQGVDKNDAEAVKWFRKAAEQGNMEAQYNLGAMYEKGQGAARNGEEAVKWYSEAAEQGDVKAQYTLGQMYHEGQGVARNDDEAVKWFNEAAEQGDVKAQYTLGQMYREGLGVVRNDDDAAKLFSEAAEQGDANAQVDLGEMYEKGQGVERKYDEALKWFNEAAGQGNVKAKSDLGEMYEKGLGVGKNYDEALKWFKEAAEHGDVKAQTKLGEMYEDGLGVSRNDEEAVKWYRKAAKQGGKVARNVLESMGKLNESKRAANHGGTKPRIKHNTAFAQGAVGKSNGTLDILAVFPPHFIAFKPAHGAEIRNIDVYFVSENGFQQSVQAGTLSYKRANTETVQNSGPEVVYTDKTEIYAMGFDPLSNFEAQKIKFVVDGKEMFFDIVGAKWVSSQTGPNHPATDAKADSDSLIAAHVGRVFTKPKLHQSNGVIEILAVYAPDFVAFKRVDVKESKNRPTVTFIEGRKEVKEGGYFASPVHVIVNKGGIADFNFTDTTVFRAMDFNAPLDFAAQKIRFKVDDKVMYYDIDKSEWDPETD
ncbi:MAG: tetratricopeptide repeat protein [Desulfuromonadales bacterium]|nr:tetratricopeptide repeat protein [Desulfuromonadales bacterium]